jgi:uncharacterized protein (TIGR03032 family)
VLARQAIVVLVTREYEHLIAAISASENAKPLVSFLPMPHPSGLAVDRRRNIVHVASTRNPNQVYDLLPATRGPGRDGPSGGPLAATRSPGSLIPIRSRFFPGHLYIHDLALLGGRLYANAVGQNAVVELHGDGRHERVWWPKCIETEAGPNFDKNFIQLNSIAAGKDLAHSYFSASSDKLSSRRPSHQNYPVDKRGVIFSGATREVVARGLTRPHSARLVAGRLWVNNSGYGELGLIDDALFRPLVRLPGWTRGLCFRDGIAFVGTSRVIPRFRQYAPGLDVAKSECGIHAVDVRSGTVLGSLIWPLGNQIFAVDWMTSQATKGFPFQAKLGRSQAREWGLFYDFSTGLERNSG